MLPLTLHLLFKAKNQIYFWLWVLVLESPIVCAKLETESKL